MTATSVYPPELVEPHPLYPCTATVQIRHVDDHVGTATVAMRGIAANTRIGKFTGIVQHAVGQHTLQITPSLHLYDPWFIGYLAHSFRPNVWLDMVTFEAWAKDDIAPGDIMSMDYSTTEDVLYRQFRDHATGRVVHGRKEQPII